MNIFYNYYWIELVLGIIAIIWAIGQYYVERLEDGRHNTNCKIYRRRTRNKMIRKRKYKVDDMGYNK